MKFTSVNQKISTITTRYHGHRFMVDIVETDAGFDAWIYTDEIGIKVFMFGVSKQDRTGDDFLVMIMDTFEDYAKSYEEDNC